MSSLPPPEPGRLRTYPYEGANVTGAAYTEIAGYSAAIGSISLPAAPVLDDPSLGIRERKQPELRLALVLAVRGDERALLVCVPNEQLTARTQILADSRLANPDWCGSIPFDASTKLGAPVSVTLDEAQPSGCPVTSAERTALQSKLQDIVSTIIEETIY